MSISIDVIQGRRVAEKLYDAFQTTGILGHKAMPEDEPPSGVRKGSLEHLIFITLTVAIDYQRDAAALWESSRRTYSDPETAYLFRLEEISRTPFNKIVADMQKHRLSKKPNKDANTWLNIATSFQTKWQGNPISFLKDCDWHGPTVLARLKYDVHLCDGMRQSDFPFLGGLKIGPLWLRMLRDNIGVTELMGLELVPIPVDIHVARATLAAGVVRGRYQGRLNELFESIRKAWAESVTGLRNAGREMVALDVDEPLWNLSKYGCNKRDEQTGHCPMGECEAKEFCVKGKIEINRGRVDLDT